MSGVTGMPAGVAGGVESAARQPTGPVGALRSWTETVRTGVHDALRNGIHDAVRRVRCRAARFRRRLAAAGEAGMSTAEYAVGTIAACGFAAVLYKIVTSSAVSGQLQQLIEGALSAKF